MMWVEHHIWIWNKFKAFCFGVVLRCCNINFYNKCIYCFWQCVNIPSSKYFCSVSIGPCAHLSNKGLSKCSCLSKTWLRKTLNFAKMRLPFPLLVVVALQYKWLTHDFIQSFTISQCFSFANFSNNFRISGKK